MWEDADLGSFRWWHFLSCHDVRSSRCAFLSHGKNGGNDIEDKVVIFKIAPGKH